MKKYNGGNMKEDEGNKRFKRERRKTREREGEKFQCDFQLQLSYILYDTNYSMSYN